MEGQLSMLSKLVPGSWFKHQSLFQVININISSQIGVYIVLPYMGGGTGVGGGGGGACAAHKVLRCHTQFTAAGTLFECS